MLAGIDDKQERYWNFIKDEYKLRNDILHGRKPKDQISGDDVEELEEIIRKCIKKFLNFSENLSIKDLKGQGKLSSRTVRDYILEELDVGLINRAKLEEFLKQSAGRFN
jgi:Fic family protein